MSRIASQSLLCTMRCTSILLLLLFTPLYAEDLYGFDSAEQIKASTFRCLASSVNFYVASVINASTGSVDSVGIENVRRASDAGIENVQAYLTPCADSNCPSAHQQVANVLGTLRQRELTLSQVWVDVSGTQWSCDVTQNRKFIWALVRSIAAYGLPVGIRTAPDRWLTIVGEWSDLSAYYPLWYARLDNRERRVHFAHNTTPHHLNSRRNVDNVNHTAANDNYEKHLYQHQYANDHHHYDDDRGAYYNVYHIHYDYDNTEAYDNAYDYDNDSAINDYQKMPTLDFLLIDCPQPSRESLNGFRTLFTTSL